MTFYQGLEDGPRPFGETDSPPASPNPALELDSPLYAVSVVWHISHLLCCGQTEWYTVDENEGEMDFSRSLSRNERVASPGW